MGTSIIILICVLILVGFALEVAGWPGGPEIQPPPNEPTPDDPPSE